MSFTIKDTDHGYRRTLAALGPLGGVTLGVQGALGAAQHKGSSEPITVAAIAEIQELGLGVPERSWLRAWIDENQGMILEDASNAMQRVIEGKLTRERALNLLGLKWVGAIQKRIAENQVQPQLDPDGPTARRKGSSTTLIDEGQLRSAITHLADVSTSLFGAGRVR